MRECHRRQHISMWHACGSVELHGIQHQHSSSSTDVKKGRRVRRICLVAGSNGTLVFPWFQHLHGRVCPVSNIATPAETHRGGSLFRASVGRTDWIPHRSRVMSSLTLRQRRGRTHKRVPEDVVCPTARLPIDSVSHPPKLPLLALPALTEQRQQSTILKLSKELHAFHLCLPC